MQGHVTLSTDNNVKFLAASMAYLYYDYLDLNSGLHMNNHIYSTLFKTEERESQRICKK